MYKNLAAAFAAACFISPVFSQITPAPSDGDPLKAGFLYVAPLNDVGWVRQHDEGHASCIHRVPSSQVSQLR